MRKPSFLLGVLAIAVVVLAALLIRQREKAVDLESERAAIRTVDSQMVAAINAGELDRWLGFFTDDAILMPPNAPAVVGKPAIRKFVSDFLASADFAVSHHLGKVEVSRSGDLAYVSYAYELTVNDPKGKPVTDRGKDISVLKKQLDGSWKVVIDIWNSDLPLPGTR